MQYPVQRGGIEESWYKWNSQFFLKRQRTNTRKIKLIVVFASVRENLPEVRILPVGLSL